MLAGNGSKDCCSLCCDTPVFRDTDEALEPCQCYTYRTVPTMRSVACLQAMEVRIAAARAVAHQWFGVLMRPRTPADAWLVEGLCQP